MKYYKYKLVLENFKSLEKKTNLTFANMYFGQNTDLLPTK